MLFTLAPVLLGLFGSTSFVTGQEFQGSISCTSRETIGPACGGLTHVVNVTYEGVVYTSPRECGLCFEVIDDGVQNYTSKHGDLEVHFFTSDGCLHADFDGEDHFCCGGDPCFY